MIPLKQAYGSTVGRKLVTGATGLLLVGFLITHLLGNLTLYKSDGTAFNTYVEKLHSFGSLLTAAEMGLAGLFIVHILNSLWIARTNARARPKGYATGLRTKGGHSRSSVASRRMAVTGSLLLIFLILHIWQFRFGPGMAEGYTVQLKGEEVRDLHRLVIEVLRNPLWMGTYVAVMVFLAMHIRHGFWSAFQTLGAMNPRFNDGVSIAALALALFLGAGFLFIPVWIYFDLGTVWS